MPGLEDVIPLTPSSHYAIIQKGIFAPKHPKTQDLFKLFCYSIPILIFNPQKEVSPWQEKYSS